MIAAVGGPPSALAAKAATTTIPIIINASDPVRSDLVASLNRPGGNVTGVSPLSALVEGKRLGLLRELVPTASTVAVLVNPNYPDADFRLKDAQDGARTLGQQIHLISASSERDIDAWMVQTAGLERPGVRHLAAISAFSRQLIFTRRGPRTTPHPLAFSDGAAR